MEVDEAQAWIVSRALERREGEHTQRERGGDTGWMKTECELINNFSLIIGLLFGQVNSDISFSSCLNVDCGTMIGRD